MSSATSSPAAPFLNSPARAREPIGNRPKLEAALARQKSLSHLRLGDALVQEGMISVAQRDAALAAQALDRSRLLGEFLVEAGALTLAALRHVLVEQLGVPSVDVAAIGCDAAALALVDARLARKYTLVPLYRTDSRIAVAMENPTWWSALADVAAATGLLVDSSLAPREQVAAAIERHYGGGVMPEEPPDLQERLRELSARVLSIQEEERRHLSRDLHDDVGQSLTALKFALHRLGPYLDVEGAAVHAACLGMAEATLDRVRHLACEMRPPQLDELGLEEALRWLVDRQRAATGLDIKCHFNGLLHRRLPPPMETACYRITQEALNNATRHAAAASILVAVEASARVLTLTIRDDGCGFEPAGRAGAGARRSGLGLIGMAERAALAGGNLVLAAEPGGGTMLRAVFPLESVAVPPT